MKPEKMDNKDNNKIFGILQGEIIRVSTILRDIDTIYGNFYSNNKELLRATMFGPCSFFDMLYEVYLNYIIITISRLIDPIKSRKNENITMEWLKDFLEEDSEKEKLEKAIYKAREELRTMRDKFIAHNDKEARISPDEKVKNIKIELNSVKDILTSFKEAMVSASKKIFGTPVSQSPGNWNLPSTGTNDLLETLKNGFKIKYIYHEVVSDLFGGSLFPPELDMVSRCKEGIRVISDKDIEKFFNILKESDSIDFISKKLGISITSINMKPEKIDNN